MTAVTIGKRKIGLEESPFVIAELSGNHNQSLERALQMVEAAAEAGVHAIKLQTYTADTMTLDCDTEDFQIGEESNLWQGQSLHQLYGQAQTPWPWHERIFERAKELGLIAFSSPFDISAVDFLETLNVPCYKIASFENNDLPLIKRVAETGKPVIMSTGMASESELAEAVEVLRNNGCDQLVLLKCTSAYPALPADANLNTIAHLRQTFNCEVGVSDHTLSLAVPITAVALGATVIEKHLVLSRQQGGVDAEFSLQPDEFKTLVIESNNAALALGKVLYGGSVSEQDSKKYRRSIYIAEDVDKGSVLTVANMRIIRPGLGLAPKYFEQLLGRKVNTDVAKGTALSWNLLES